MMTAPYKRNLFLGAPLLILTFWVPPALYERDALFFLQLSWVSPAGGLLVIGALIAHHAAWDFARQGGGTPFPLDPPVRLVTTGAYGWVRNPMQLGVTLMGCAWAWLLGDWVYVLIPAGILVYAIGFCAQDEHEDMVVRYGAAYTAYRSRVRNWWPVPRRSVTHTSHRRASRYIGPLS